MNYLRRQSLNPRNVFDDTVLQRADRNIELNPKEIVSVKGNILVAGDLAINGGDLTTTASAFNLLNSGATTVNFAGGATNIQIGSSSGTTNINNNLDVDGDINIDGGDLTVSTSTFNLANTIATTVNAFGASTSIKIGAATGTTTINNASTVVAGDLAVNGGDLTTTSTTFNLLDTTATTVNFARSGTSITIGSTTGQTVIRNAKTVLSGDLEVNGGDIVTDQTTFNLLNTTAETINFAGDSTTVNIGSSSGTTTVKNNLNVDLQTTLSSVSVSDLTSGRVVLAGIGGELEDSDNLTFVDDKLTVTGSVEITSNLTVGGNLVLGNQETDTISVSALFTSDLTPSTDLVYNLGKINTRWKEVYAGKFVGEIYGGTY